MTDSPLSDDSLSSIGASTEPLPTSEGHAPDAATDSRSPPPTTWPKAKHGSSFRKTVRGSGNESDSTLTEQSSSEGNVDDADEDEEDDDPGQPTPRAKGASRAAVIPDDEEEDLATSMTKLSSVPDDISELSSPAPSEKIDDETSAAVQSPSLKGTTPKDDPVVAPDSASSRASSAERAPETPRNKARPPEDDVENEALSPPSDDHEEAAEERRRASAAAKRGSTARGRGGRGRGARARGRGGKKAGSARPDADATDADDLSDVEAAAQLANVPPPTASKRGKGSRGRGGRGKRGGGRGAASASNADRQKSPSIKNELEDHPPSDNDALVAEAGQAHEEPDSQMTDVPAQGVTQEETADVATPIAVENGDELAADEDAASVNVEEAPDTTAEHTMEVDVDAEAVVEEEKTQPKKRGGKKGKKGAKGKDKVAVAVDAEDDEAGTPAASDQEADQDEMQSRKRLEAMEELTKIEIAFASLRNRLYTERMAEVEKERLGVETGTHPELIHLNRLIELRRKTKLDVAKKLLDGLCVGYEKRLIEAEHAVWQAWANGRNDLRSNMFVEAMSKRRKLEREKRQLDRPKEDTLTALLAPRPLPAVPLHRHRRLGFDGEVLTVNDILWSLRHADARSDAVVSCLDEDAARSDLEHMGLRKPVPVLAPSTFESFSAPPASSLSSVIPPTAAPISNGYPYPLPAIHYAQMAPAPPPGPSVQQPLPPPAYLTGYGAQPPPLSAQPSHTVQRPPAAVLDYPAPGYVSANAFGSSPFVPADKDRSGASWQGTSTASDDARRRARTPSGGNNLFVDSLDHVARQRERSHDGAKLGHRPSLDDHMAHARSPKQHRSSHSTGGTASSAPAPPFLHIPSFRDLQRDAAAANAAPVHQQSEGYPRYDHKDAPPNYGTHAPSNELMRAT
ncbi:hypothetical protein ACM66B_003797 [Microbotryomycetes sp. NB124-2]